jgi:anti-anti-sigma factor
MNLLLNVRRDDHGTPTMYVGGEIDLCSGGQLLEYAFDVMREHGPWLAVNLAGVTFMDCGGVHALLAIRRRTRLLGGQLRVISASAPVRRVLEIIEMDIVLAAPERSEANNWRKEDFLRWHCFRPGQAAALSAPELSRFVMSRTCTSGWTSC